MKEHAIKHMTAAGGEDLGDTAELIEHRHASEKLRLDPRTGSAISDEFGIGLAG